MNLVSARDFLKLLCCLLPELNVFAHSMKYFISLDHLVFLGPSLEMKGLISDETAHKTYILNSFRVTVFSSHRFR